MFFFFKQKTAYEMRISDWSSDVCSSDLLDAIDRCGRDEIEVGRRATLGGARPSLKICGAVTPLSVHQDQCVVRVEAAKRGAQRKLGRIGAKASRAERRDEQNGRASCRERVGQYV